MVKIGFLADLNRSIQVICGMVMREGAERFARRSMGLVEELGSILIHVIGFSALRVLAGASEHRGLPAVPFLVSGVFTYWIFKTTFVQLSSYHSSKPRYLIFARVTQLDVQIGRFFVNLGLYIPLTLLSYYTLIPLGLGPAPYDVPGVILALALAAIWGFGMGLILGGVFARLPILRTLSSGFLRMLLYTSGVFFVWPEVPFDLRFIVIWNPFMHLEELMHESYFQAYRSDLFSPAYIAGWIVGCVALGLIIERSNRRRFSTRRGHVAEDPYENALDDGVF